MMWFWVALGGALGACSRVLVFELSKYFHFSSALSTLSVNLVGSFVLGVLYGFFHTRLTSELYAIAALGFLGSFTTFSTFALDINLMLKSSLSWSVAYIAFSVLGSILLCYLGLRLAANT